VPDKPLSYQVLDAFDPANLAKDLIVVALWVVAAILCIYIPLLNDSFLRVLFALPMILFVPGYTLIAALFPGKEDLDGIERLALSFGLSIAVVPLIGLVMNYTPWGIRLDPIVISLVIFTAAMILVAQYRRSLLPPEQRFFVPFQEIRELFPAGASRIDQALSLLLIAAVVAAVAATVYVIVVPREGEKFTEFYILGKEGKAAGYPAELVLFQPETVIIGIGNHEYRNVTYFVEILLLDNQFDPETNTSSILSMERMASFSVTVPHNTTYEQRHSFTPENGRANQVKFLLFKDTLPPDSVWGQDRINASYRDLHLWVRVKVGPGISR